MSTSAESPHSQAARFLAMAADARDEGKSGVADLLTEIARRVTAAELALVQVQQQDGVVDQSQQETVLDDSSNLALGTAAGLNE